MRLIQVEQRTVVLQEILVHPVRRIVLFHFPGDCPSLVVVGQGKELVGNDRGNVVRSPMGPDVVLVGRILLPDEVKADLVCHGFHLVRMLLLNGLQGTGDRVRTAPRLEPHGPVVRLIQEDLNNVL
jgi:hypothetical protein